MSSVEALFMRESMPILSSERDTTFAKQVERICASHDLLAAACGRPPSSTD